MVGISGVVPRSTGQHPAPQSTVPRARLSADVGLPTLIMTGVLVTYPVTAALGRRQRASAVEAAAVDAGAVLDNGIDP